MADPKPLNRQQLAKICNNDPEAIRLFERLFQVAGQTTPNLIDENQFGGDMAGQIDALRADVQGYADLVQRASEIIAANDLQGRQEHQAPDHIAMPAREPRRHCYGQFYDTTTQTVGAINTATVIAFNSTDIAAGVWVSSNQIKVAEAGVYNFQLSVQLDKTSGGVGHFYLWFRKNGTDIPNSASRVRVQGNNAEIFTAMNWFIAMGQADYIEVIWAADDADVQIAAFAAAAPVPATPSIILTVSNNLEGEK